MSFAVEAAKNEVEKHELVVLKPRKRLTGWTLHSGNVWYTSFTGKITDVWRDVSERGTWDEMASAAAIVSLNQYYHDTDLGRLYVDIGYPAGPDDSATAVLNDTVPGVTVEFALFLATDAFTGPMDPLDSASETVDWLPAIEKAPTTTVGSKLSLFGFNPIEESVLVILNQDGEFTELLRNASFHLSEVRAYAMADTDLEDAVENGNIREVFRGYSGGMEFEESGNINIVCDNLFARFSKLANPSQRMSISEFPNADPQSVLSGQEWFIRQVRGMVENHIPINIDYDDTPATNVNRDFLTHEGTGTEGTWGATVDHTGTNNATTTTLQTTPKCNPGDAVIIQRSGVDKYAIVSAVNRATKQITHSSITGSAAASDQIIRYYVGWVMVQDSDGNWWNLFAGRNFSRINKGTLGNNPDWLGFRLIDNWEGDVGFPETFDPRKHKIICRVYGTDSLQKYPDGTTDCGAVSDHSGVASEAISSLYWLLLEAGIPTTLIDQTSFAAAPTNHSIGFAIPARYNDTRALSYAAYLNAILQSMLWKLTMVADAGELKLGLLETQPITTTDLEAGDGEFSGFNFSHHYADLANRIELTYLQREYESEDTQTIYGNPASPTEADCAHKVYSENQLARDLHLMENTFELSILQHVTSQAQVIADRLSYALGDRRGFYSIALGSEYLAETELGAGLALSRKQLPGYAFDPETDRTEETVVIEMEKSNRGATLVLEDQKGIQDHESDWS